MRTSTTARASHCRLAFHFLTLAAIALMTLASVGCAANDPALTAASAQDPAGDDNLGPLEVGPMAAPRAHGNPDIDTSDPDRGLPRVELPPEPEADDDNDVEGDDEGESDMNQADGVDPDAMMIGQDEEDWFDGQYVDETNPEFGMGC